MIRLFQKITFFSISKFEAAVKAMNECGKEPWTEKISKEQKQMLQQLYMQATGGMSSKMTQERGTSPNFDSPMESFRSMMGKQTAQGATEDEVHRHFFKPREKSKQGTGQNKTQLKKQSRSVEDAGKMQTEATQSLAKGQTVDTTSEPMPKINADISRSTVEDISKEGYGNRTGSHPIPGGQPPGSNPYKQSQQLRTQSRSREQAEKEYIELVKGILQTHKGEKYVNDF